MVIRKQLHLFLTTASAILFSFPLLAHADKTPTVPKWQRFEVALKSSAAYTNALQQAEVRALFVSPLGETNRVYGFWDGGRTWRVRFQPNFPGRWTYYTMCSDTANRGLHDQAGEFLCTAAKGESRFDLHGPVQIARNQQHLEHADRTPFFWLGDAAWLAALKSTPANWEDYIQTRALQKFNVVQWRLNSVGPDEKSVAFAGRERIQVNLAFFRQLDAKVVSANRAGLLSAIAPLWEIDDAAEESLPEDQAILLLRYAVARWGAENVAWIVAFECDSTGDQAKRWQNIGRAVFSYVAHAPVILLPGESVWVFDAFRRERWVDVLGVQTALIKDESSLPWLLNGPLGLERRKLPARPVITLAPPAEAATGHGTNSMTSDFLRRIMWWSLLLNTPAGVSYGAKEVEEWTTTPSVSALAEPWRKALALPGAEAIASLAGYFESKEFWQMEPFSQVLTTQPGQLSPLRHIAASSMESGNVTMVYVPDERSVDIVATTFAARSQATWFNPRTGKSQPADGVLINPTTYRFTTPAKGDWLLVLNRVR